MRNKLGSLLVAGLALAGCSAAVIDTPYQPYTIRLWGPDRDQVAPGSTFDPFTVTSKYKVRVNYFEDAAGTVPYGSSLATKPDPFKDFTFGSNKTTFTLGDAAQALPQTKAGASIFLQAEIIGVGEDGSTQVARGRCPLMELKPVAAGGDKPVECKAFFGLIGKWNPVKAPADARYSFGAAVLPDGRVVIAGGKQATTVDAGAPLGTVEMFEPTAENQDGTLGAWRRAGQLSEPRFELTAAASREGLVFFAGGKTSDANFSRKVDVFDSSGLGTVKLGGGLSNELAEHAAAPFKDNVVVLAGGKVSQNTINSNAIQLTASSSQPLAAFRDPRSYPCLVAVSSNSLLLCGGGVATCQTFDGANFNDAGRMLAARTGLKCAAVDGQVFIVGGLDDANNRAIEVWSAGGVQPFDNAPRALLKHAVAVSNGKVVVSGGYAAGTSDYLKTGFWFDPKAGGVHEIAGADTEMAVGRAFHEMVGLPDGTVMAIGGRVKQGDTKTPGAEIFVVPDAATN